MPTESLAWFLTFRISESDADRARFVGTSVVFPGRLRQPLPPLTAPPPGGPGTHRQASRRQTIAQTPPKTKSPLRARMIEHMRIGNLAPATCCSCSRGREPASVAKRAGCRAAWPRSRHLQAGVFTRLLTAAPNMGGGQTPLPPRQPTCALRAGPVPGTRNNSPAAAAFRARGPEGLATMCGRGHPCRQAAPDASCPQGHPHAAGVLRL